MFEPLHPLQVVGDVVGAYRHLPQTAVGYPRPDDGH